MKVARIVMNGQVFFSKEYTRMVKRNACVVLFVNGKVGCVVVYQNQTEMRTWRTTHYISEI